MNTPSNTVVGIHPVSEALSSDKEIDKILIARDMASSEAMDIAKKAKEKDIPVQRVPKVKLDKLSNINHQGILAFISPIAYVSIDDMIEEAQLKNEAPLLIILDGITDTRNLGAICRTAECMGAHGIIMPKNNSAPVTEGTIKSSAGAVLKLKLARVNHLLDAIYHLQASEVSVIAFTEKANNTVDQIDIDKKGVAIILGAEDKGIHQKLIKTADNHLKIRMFGSTDSLNVGVAAGMILYQIRQKI
ncbi:MAG: 23S rRNA (guanosine(2251)-2'-O)-methyltransferase RlmB [Flavobacteriales bacterium]